MDPVITLDLNAAEQLLECVDNDDELREELVASIIRAEMGDICNDVFLFQYTASYELVCLENDIDFVISK